ncbi:Mercuric transport protein MerT [Nitrosococcus halophilus Nc 4]|uniref:Mercuric transport protein MerT n=1 Tax=Nitrosococcus halophilus (strain Nc4) TaxID=472759 RepID=D5C2E8_NITHN|nr:mercuric transporter MerT family protein [Nitrosococcus halophilus]ADE14807.1 Mercuric transport protein MerT [Nitrosococcus halophilus Nc 4]
MSTKSLPKILGNETPAPEQTKRQNRLLVTGSLVGAVLASSCCILPLLLLTLGVSGAWISHLTVLAPYQPFFLVATFGFLGAGFWKVYWKPKVRCEEGSYCASPTSDRVLKTALWIATALVLTTLGINFLGPLFL